MNRGYISLWRKFQDSLIYNDSQAVHLWIHLLLKATHKEINLLVGGIKVNLKVGQLLTGRKSLSKETGINESKINRILKLLKNEQLIEQQTTNKYSIITVLNWDLYQTGEQQTEQQVNSKRTANEQQVNTNKK